ncbi:MAG TPA: tripartite tricarboxylate transporter substrate binding protein [Burkholderiales bacterium]|nr:tripartite tricarboxylate transporter substrate binding protein [Burkholderiales bacterium]
MPSMLRAALACAFALLSCMPAVVYGQAYPSKPIRLIVPFPPGGGNDVIGRAMAQKLTERFGQQVIVDNRAGANGIVGLQALMQSAPDGYTLGVGAAGPMAVNPSLYDKLPYDPVKDFTAITNMVNFPLLLVAHPSLPAKNVRELIALAKAKPGTIYFSSPGSGNSGHLAGELFNTMAGVKTVHVPYKGQGPALADLLAGQVQLLYSSIPSVMPHVQSGRLRALAIGSAKRIPSLSEVPTIAESGVPGYEAYSWVGMIGPAHMPRDLTQRLSREINDALKQKDFNDKLNSEGALPDGDTPEQFTAYIKAEIDKWGAVVRSANIKVD